MKSEQWKWVDIAKGIGIILVFLGHFNIPDTLRAEIYTFHIPLFFFLSGVLLFCFVQAACADRTRTKCQYWQ